MNPPQLTGQITNTYNVYVNPYGMRRLSPYFRPGEYDVLCARGKMAYDHEGNRRFRALVKQHQKQYSAANCKYEKSKIVSFIVSTVRNSTAQGGFVKNIDGHWFEVGDRHAKEKVGQTFRDLLHNKYSSSTKAKARARVQKRIKDSDDKKDSKTNESKPDSVPSGSPTSKDTVSIVSDVESDAITEHRSNKLPPLRSVVVKKEQPQSTPTLKHPGQAYLPRVSPFRTQRAKASLETRRRGSAASLQMPLPSDLEPLPLRDSVKVDFNASSSSIQS